MGSLPGEDAAGEDAPDAFAAGFPAIEIFPIKQGLPTEIRGEGDGSGCGPLRAAGEKGLKVDVVEVRVWLVFP